MPHCVVRKKPSPNSSTAAGPAAAAVDEPLAFANVEPHEPTAAESLATTNDEPYEPTAAESLAVSSSSAYVLQPLVPSLLSPTMNRSRQQRAMFTKRVTADCQAHVNIARRGDVYFVASLSAEHAGHRVLASRRAAQLDDADEDELTRLARAGVGTAARFALRHADDPLLAPQQLLNQERRQTRADARKAHIHIVMERILGERDSAAVLLFDYEAPLGTVLRRQFFVKLPRSTSFVTAATLDDAALSALSTCWPTPPVTPLPHDALLTLDDVLASADELSEVMVFTGVAFTTIHQLVRFARYPHTLVIDATARTNVLGHPAVPVVGVDAARSSFDAFVALVPDERVVSFKFILLDAARLLLGRATLARMLRCSSRLV